LNLQYNVLSCKTAISLALQCKALVLVFTSALSVQPLPWFTKLLSHNVSLKDFRHPVASKSVDWVANNICLQIVAENTETNNLQTTLGSAHCTQPPTFVSNHSYAIRASKNNHFKRLWNCKCSICLQITTFWNMLTVFKLHWAQHIATNLQP
jgi:hypothetical protein